jgi:hypothetical protein
MTTGWHVGWVRQTRSKWYPAVWADSRVAAIDALLEYAATAAGPHKDLVVLPIGREPFRQPGPSVRVRPTPPAAVDAAGPPEAAAGSPAAGEAILSNPGAPMGQSCET